MRIFSFAKHVHTDDFRSTGKKNAPTSVEVASKGAIAGAATGAIVGAGVGYVQGLGDLKNPQATVTDETYYSTRPELVGAEYDDADMLTRYNPSTKSTEFYWTDDDWDPIIKRHAVTPYQKPVFHSERPGMLKSVAGGAIKGAAAGAAIGAVGAVAARAAGLEGFGSQEILRDTPLAMAIGGAGGALVGGVAGYHAGSVAQSNALVEVRTAPTYQRQQIGWMPFERNASQISRDLGKGGGNYTIRYDELEGSYGNPPFQGQDKVYSNVQIDEHQQEYRSSTLTPWKGAAFGALTGGILGVAAGAAASVISRMAEA